MVILVLAAVQLNDLSVLHGRAQQQFEANIARNKIARATLALGRERNAIFLSLAIGAEARSETAVETDRSFAAIRLAVAGAFKSDDAGTEADLAAVFLKTLPEMRADAAAAMLLPLGSQARQKEASQWLAGISLVVKDLRAIRLRLLDLGDTGENLFSIYHLRTLTLILLDEIMKNDALLEVETVRQANATLSTAEAGLLDTAPLGSIAPTETAVSVAPFEEILAALGEGHLGVGFGSFDAQVYGDAERALRQALLSGSGLDEAVLRWRRVSAAAILQLDELQAATFRVMQNHVIETRTEAWTNMLIWGLVLCASALILGVSFWVVLALVVGPLERMRVAMLELANENLAVSLPKPNRIREIGAMDDALRVFKANASRRQTLQRERLKLHGRLEETYTHLKTDLEAAALIQASLLPQQAQMAGVSLSSYFRPSNFLAGDTFDVLQQADGRVIVFQIDVAGHGAAAALVSIASKYTVAQAILQRPTGSNLADLAKEINREWPSDLPYFTLLLAEIDHSTEQGTLVQAGHPSPILLRSNGDLVALGEGGLPIGALAQATFDAVSFSFGPNDRLVMATDGVHEMESPDGEPFSDERLQKVLRGGKGKTTEQIIDELDVAMRSWRGDDTLDDDVTIVVLEGKRVDGHQ
ncbi:PP2C family protein-serine/threonine phosphatase [Pararhizobium antarcticum]|nr:SpoIIE family protein phosphatase [Pararhizobium antarcticum]